MNILLAEDEKGLSDALSQILRDHKVQVDAVYNGNDALYYAMHGDYDAIVCDIMMPGLDGNEVVRRLRKEHINTPIIMLTARTSLSDKVKGLDSGADDYMTKPFQPAELLARLRALTRRQGEVIIDELSFGDLVLGISSYDLSCNGESVRLSNKEFEVMKLLMMNAKCTVSKDSLISKVWGVDSYAEDNNVEAYISFLRKKLRFLNSNVNIVTQRLVGYRLEESDSK